MKDARLRKKGAQDNKLSAVVREKSPYFCLEFVFSKRLEGNESFFYMGFKFERVKPGVSSEMVYYNKIVFVVINRDNRRCP